MGEEESGKHSVQCQTLNNFFINKPPVKHKRTQTTNKSDFGDKLITKTKSKRTTTSKGKETQTFLTTENFSINGLLKSCASPSYASSGTQTEDESSAQTSKPDLTFPLFNEDCDSVDKSLNCDSSEFLSDDDDEYDPDFDGGSEEEEPLKEANDEMPEKITLSSSKPPQEQMKFIIFEEALVKCFESCFKCGGKCIVGLQSSIGTFCHISVRCLVNSHHDFTWSTGPLHNRMPVLHLLITSGIFSSGLECAKVVWLFHTLKIKAFSHRQFSSLQSSYVIPAVFNVWNREKARMLREIKGTPRCIESDMRVDSPGHCGLFGSRSSSDVEKNVILDTL